MDASMNSAIRATIPILTAPLVDICSPGALDSLHVALMSTLSAHLLPTWDASRPSLGAPLRVLHLAPNTVPRPLDKAAQQIRIKGADWVSLLLVHNRTRAMSISVDPGMVAVQLAEQPVPTVCWQEELASNSTTRASSPISSTPSSSSSSAEPPWNARKSRLPSLVARQPPADSSSAKMLVGSPRTPKSLNGFTFPLSAAASASASGAPQLSSDVFYGRTEEEEPSWMTSLLSNFPDTPAPAAPSGHHSRAPSQQTASASQTSLRANAPAYRPAQVRGGLRPAGAGHARSESTDSWASSTRSSPTSTTQHRLSPIGSSPSATAAASNANGGIYSQLALNMSQLSLASTSTSSSCAPSLSSSASSTSSQRAASPTDQLIPGADGFYHFDVSVPAPAGNIVYYDDGLPSPISPTASVYAYVDHAARKSVTEYECGKVGVLGGAVMLGVPVGPKKQNRNSMPPMSTLTTATNTLPHRGPLPNFDLATAPSQAMA